MAKTAGTAERQVTTTAVHLSLQGKGGVGKSLVASLLAQYFRSRGDEVRCIDTDPVNQTFSQYRGLGAQHLQLMREGGLDQRGFDSLMERLLTEDGTFVVDSGASSFIPLWNYMLENNVAELLRDAGRKLYVHCVVTGGQALLDTLNGMNEIAQSTTDRNLVVWVNEYFGRVERDGKALPDMGVFHKNVDRICGTVTIVKRNQDTFGRDVEEMISRKLTFQEAVESGDFPIMVKQRLKVVQRGLFEQLDALAWA